MSNGVLELIVARRRRAIDCHVEIVIPNVERVLPETQANNYLLLQLFG